MPTRKHPNRSGTDWLKEARRRATEHSEKPPKSRDEVIRQRVRRLREAERRSEN